MEKLIEGKEASDIFLSKNPFSALEWFAGLVFHEEDAEKNLLMLLDQTRPQGATALYSNEKSFPVFSIPDLVLPLNRALLGVSRGTLLCRVASGWSTLPDDFRNLFVQ